ncbi:hypothetical protein PanWU01x14_223130 [Parasponia andersonii]|uniref:Uncharacterized protein n=1 Tax=Parasponia andersonii TaxID=3476 RepID=A0A2P5BNS0_PARAD|nr:hypothetical protein PanWU01x14_223130 [Parasponia andersonii]
MSLQEQGHVLAQEVVGPEPLRQELQKRVEVVVLGSGRFGAALVVPGIRRRDQDLDIRGSADFLEELAAMAAGGGGNGDVLEVGLAVDGEVRDEELLGVDGVVEGETRELEVDADKDPTR